MRPNCYMLDSTHKFDRTDISMREQGCKTASERCQVIIEDDVWIGRDVMILNSKTIKKDLYYCCKNCFNEKFSGVFHCRRESFPLVAK